MDWRSILIQLIGFGGILFFLASYQVRSNKRLFVLQTLGCLTFCVQFALLGAYSGCVSVLINVMRNMMMTKYQDYGWIRWRGWVAVFPALSLAFVLLTWSGPASPLPVVVTTAGTAACWTNNARTIRLVNLTVNSPCTLLYDVLIRSWAGALNEGLTMAAIVVSIVRFGWAALDGDTVRN